MIKIEFAYLIKPEAKMAHDENGNDCECYSMICINYRKQPAAEYNKLHKDFAGYIAKQFKIDESYITPITMADYYASTEDEYDEMEC